MARKARQRISYVLPLANSNGHRLGVNSLAVDPEGTLYSAGRDGLICSWDLGANLTEQGNGPLGNSKFKTQIQAHTHWVNDIILTHQNQAVVSCSSDLTVKVWRPYSYESKGPQTIGHHSDYVKCLVAPRSGDSGWVASGGLDRKIKLWDLEGRGEILEIDVKEEGSNPKGSVYALAQGGNVLASGGPESVVRIWDPRSGTAITKFVGHTDNIRAILVSEQGDYILTASSDTTIKMWSMTGGRCLHTFTMHNDSVWSLFSSHPRLEIFHSSDRTGLVAKTDIRNVKELEEGICVAVCQEKEGVRKVVPCGYYTWTTTSSSNIKRWIDVDTNGEVVRSPARSPGSQKAFVNAPQPGSPSASRVSSSPIIPFHSLLSLSSASTLHANVRDPDAVTVYSVEKQASFQDILLDSESTTLIPINQHADEVIEGHDGLIKHFLLNDRRRVLTLDTAGVVVMWDLIRCTPIKNFGQRDLEDVAAEVNSVETVANWCQVDTRTGQLACVLEENYCFDAEMYADEIESESSIEYRDDQRINLGKWVLRYLFANLIDEEIRRDDVFRKRIEQQKDVSRRPSAPLQIQLPISTTFDDNGPASPNGGATPRAQNNNFFPQTPNLAIGLATPGPGLLAAQAFQVESSADESTEIATPIRSSNAGDYFGNAIGSNTNGSSGAAVPPTPGSGDAPSSPTAETPSETASTGGFFKFRGFGSKKSKASANEAAKSAADDAKPIESEPVIMPSLLEPVYEDTVGGVVAKLRSQYDSQPLEETGLLKSRICPSLPGETPVLKLPHNTAIIIQEDKPDSGGVVDLYRGTVASVGSTGDVDLLESTAPSWLGDVLLLNKIPFKETVKISFVLQPYSEALPPINIVGDSNSRLNANRMLRAKKILTYIAEKLPPSYIPTMNASDGSVGQMKPEEWLELVCHGQLVPGNMTLATMRSHVWKSGGDVVLLYRLKENVGTKEERLTEDKTASPCTPSET